MARIRTVKPELFRHEELFELEQTTGLPIRISFIALFTVCDREGRFKWRPRQLKLDCLPYDQIDFSKVLDALKDKGFIKKYSIDGEDFGVLPGFNTHQVINMREAKSTIPPPPIEEKPPEPIKHVHARAYTEMINGVQVQCAGVNIPKTIRAFVFERDGFACVRCGREDALHIDHIFPKSIGGTHAVSNLRVLCESCNCSRPVSGEGLINDLAIDGLTMADMERTCKHMQAHGEKEGKGREKEEERKGNKRATRAKKAKTLLPDNFSITDSVASWYSKQGYVEEIKLHLESFKNKSLAKAYEYADWDAAFRNAIADDWAGIRQKSPGTATNRNQGFQGKTATRPDYSSLWEGLDSIDSTATRILA